MKLKTIRGLIICLSIIFSTSAAIADSSYVTGSTWQQSTENEKLAYVMGIANVVNAEHAVQVESAQPPTNNNSAVPEMYAALGGATLEGIVSEIDAYFGANPDQVGDTVLDVIWLIYVEEQN